MTLYVSLVLIVIEAILKSYRPARQALTGTDYPGNYGAVNETDVDRRDVMLDMPRRKELLSAPNEWLRSIMEPSTASQVILSNCSGFSEDCRLRRVPN